MKVLQITNSFALDEGGAQRLALNFHQAFSSQGVESHLLALTHSPTGIAENSYSLQLRSPYQKEVLPRLIRFLRQPRWRDLDIIHVHLFPAQTLVALALKIVGLRAKLVTTEHNTYNRRRKLRIGPVPVGRLCDVWTYRQYEKIVCISEGTHKALVEWMPATATRVATIANGIDLSLYPPRSVKAQRDKNVILSLGRISEQKNYKTALRAISLISEYDFEYWIAGRDEMKGKIQALAAELGIEERVRFLGYRADAPHLLQEADIFFLPSLWEGFGLVAAEAMASGLPIVASDVDGLREVLDTKQSDDTQLTEVCAAFLVNPSSAEEMAKRLTQLLDDVALRQAMGKVARSHSQHYDLQRTYESYLRLYICIRGGR